MMNARHWVLMMAWIGILPLSASSAGEKIRQAEEPEWVDVGLFDAIDADHVRTAVVADGFSQMTLRVVNVTPTPLRIAVPEVFAALPVARQQVAKEFAAAGCSGQPGARLRSELRRLAGIGRLAGRPLVPADRPVGHCTRCRERRGPAGTRSNLVGSGRRPTPISDPVFLFGVRQARPEPPHPLPIGPINRTQRQSGRGELLERFGRGGCDQRVAQLAVWHVANGVPWAMLARLDLPQATGRGTRSVKPVELLAARQLAESLPSYGQSASLGRP